MSVKTIAIKIMGAAKQFVTTEPGGDTTLHVYPERAQAAEEPMTCAEAARQCARVPGDTVRLRSCEVWMTVLYSSCHEVDCAWFCGRELHQETFPLECVTSEPEMPF